MAELKREYVVPLRRKTRTAPKWRRSKKAVSVLKDFIKKHMKTDNVVICNELNETIWARGIKKPPGKVAVVALKTQLSGVEKTLVNLSSVGIDSQLELYKELQKQPEPEKETQEETQEDSKEDSKEETQEDSKEEKIQDAEAVEVEKKEESPKEDTKTQDEKETQESKKKEVKKDE